jgi:L,D-transpeptidase catalytic domain
VRSRPWGEVIARLGPRSDFGSPLVVSVAKRRGRWLGVIASGVPNGRLGWVRAGAMRTAKVQVRLEVSLARRRLLVLRGDTVVRRIRVGVGASSTATPTGRFAITDKLAGADYGAAYGCCILAISGNQPHPPPGWDPAESRLAIHGGAQGAVSAGCLHAATAELRYLMKRIPLGTRITIRA